MAIMSGKFYKIFIAMLLVATSLHGAPVDPTTKILIDSLELRLQEIEGYQDSITALYNIFDLSPTVKMRNNTLKRLYRAAKTNGNDKDCFDILNHVSRIFQDNDSVLDLVETELSGYPESPGKKESMLYVKMQKAENFAHDIDRDTSPRTINDLISRYSDDPPDDAYEQAELLFALCITMRKSTQGELLEMYLNKLIEHVESMDLSTGLVRNLIYSRTAPIYTCNRLYSDAIAVDKKLLNVLDSIATAYESHGRPYRKLYSNHYDVCRRMLINYRGLTPEEVEYFYNGIKEISRHDPIIAERIKKNEDVEMFHHIARKEYAQALPILKRQLNNPMLERIRNIMLGEIITAAQAVGDKESELEAMRELNAIYEEVLNGADSDRLRELQILYDLSDLRKESAEKQLEAKEQRIKFIRIMLIVAGVVVLILIAMIYIMLRQFRRLKRLTAEHFSTTVKLRAERNDLKRVQQELIEARDHATESERMKTEFTNMMSHEVKAPLAAVQEYSRLIVDCIPDDQGSYLDRFAYIIEQNVKTLNRIVSDVLDISSYEMGSMTITKSVESVHNICEIAIDSVFNNNKGKSPDVTVTFNSAGRPDVNIITDKVRVTQVLMNILDNADKFTEKGSIALDYEMDESTNTITFSISDTGIGLPDNCEEIIFERYRKLSSLSRGLGMGLYLARNIARLLNGDVQVDTDYRGGSRFIFTIKL